VNWTISPSLGSISASGLYTAPASITSAQAVTVTARSAADTTKTASAIVNLVPPDVISISLSPASATVKAGQTQPLAAQIAGNANAQLTWKITPAFGTLTPSGSSAVYSAPASVTLQQVVEVEVRSVANPNAFAKSVLTVQPADPPSSGEITVSVSPTTKNMEGGQSQLFSATVTGTTNTAVTWSISPAVGAISSTGLYVAPLTVSATQVVAVTARSMADTSKTATALVTLVPPEVISLSLSPTSSSVKAGLSQSFAVQVTGNASSPLTWTLTPNVGTVVPTSLTAVYTAPTNVTSQQTVELEVRSVVNPNAFAKAILTLLPPDPEVQISVSPTSKDLRGGESHTFVASVTGSSNTGVTWSHSPQVGTLGANGAYTAPETVSAPQTVVITARSVADATKSASAVVNLLPPEVTSISISPTSKSLNGGQSQLFAAQITGNTNSPVAWTITPNLGTISPSGASATYTAPASVTTQQTVQVEVRSVANPSAFATATVTLVPPAPVVQISVSPTSKDLRGGEAQAFVASVTGATNTSVTWTYSPQVGTLSSAGLYTAPTTITTAQTIVVTARSVADTTKTATATVNLLPPEVTSISITPTSKSLNSGQSQVFSAQIVGNQSSPLTWTRTPAVGTLSANGTSATFTAPSSVTTQQAVTVEVRSVANPSAYATATVTLVADPPVTYSISGRVSGSSATLSLSGPSAGTATTNGSGDYTFTGLSNGLYVVSPSRTGYSFSPSSTSVTIASASVTGINFTGTAIPPAPRSVLLNWNSSPSPNVVGYNLYRATSSPGPYSKITPTPVSATSYTDTNVTTGSTYYYYAAAIDSGGIESAYSNQATAPVN
jgi:hypothetical protein